MEEEKNVEYRANSDDHRVDKVTADSTSVGTPAEGPEEKAEDGENDNNKVVSGNGQKEGTAINMTPDLTQDLSYLDLNDAAKMAAFIRKHINVSSGSENDRPPLSGGLVGQTEDVNPFEEYMKKKAAEQVTDSEPQGSAIKAGEEEETGSTGTDKQDIESSDSLATGGESKKGCGKRAKKTKTKTDNEPKINFPTRSKAKK